MFALRVSPQKTQVEIPSIARRSVVVVVIRVVHFSVCVATICNCEKKTKFIVYILYNDKIFGFFFVEPPFATINAISVVVLTDDIEQTKYTPSGDERMTRDVAFVAVRSRKRKTVHTKLERVVTVDYLVF